MPPEPKQPLLLSFPGNARLGEALASVTGAEVAEFTLRRFPDGESYIRIENGCANRSAVIVCSLDRPDDKMLGLYFLCKTLRDLGVSHILLVAPYLAYMRQDRRFREGEGITAHYFAEWVSTFIDGLITVDPHLHRINDLDEVYRVPSRIVHAADAVAEWIGREVEQPVLVGPDEESWQWVSDVAGRAKAPHIVLQKTRHGDRDVEVSIPDLDQWQGHTPVLVDDIISTGRTMIETIGHLKRLGFPGAVCIGVHGIFADEAYRELRKAGALRVVSCNTVPHESNTIDLTSGLGQALNELLDSEPLKPS